MLGDNQRHTTIGDVKNSNIAVGDHITQKLHIEQSTDGDLKNLLQKLSAVIDNATLSKPDRLSLETQLQQLTTQAGELTPPKAEISKTIGVLKELGSIFKDIPSVVNEYSSLLGELSGLFN